MASLVLERIRIDLGRRRLIEIDAAVGLGEVLTVMGPSGTGKSTLLGFVCGVLDPAFTIEGRVLLNGQDITDLPPEQRRIGMLFQDALLFPHLSVAGNLLVALPPDVRGRFSRRARIAEALSAAGLEGFGDRDPATLSGGQQARIALIRTLLARPQALLLDEPFSRLDTTLRTRIRAFTFAEIRRHALPAILVTHDAADAADAGGPVLELGRDMEREIVTEQL